jgi:hypothetical protein
MLRRFSLLISSGMHKPRWNSASLFLRELTKAPYSRFCRNANSGKKGRKPNQSDLRHAISSSIARGKGKNLLLHANERSLKAVCLDWLGQVVQRMHFKGLHRIVVVRRNEYSDSHMRQGTRACLRNLAPNLGELKRRPEESCDRLKAKQSDIADKLKELCQSKAFFVPRRLKITRRVG